MKRVMKTRTLYTVSQRRDWEDLATLDPHWAILSDPDRQHDGWDQREFLATGRETIRQVLEQGAQHELPKRHETALDFGCGVGRLTRVLAQHFPDTLGLDVSPEMISKAEGARFEVASDLRNIENNSMDLVLSHLTIQHVPSGISRSYLVGELMRVLRPGGLLSLQLPSRIPWRNRLQPRPRAYRLLRMAGVPSATLYQRGLHPISMGALPAWRVEGIIEGNRGRLLDVRHETQDGLVSSVYLASK